MYTRRDLICWIFAAVFCCGLLLVFFAFPLGELLARQYMGPGMYSWDPDEAKFRAVGIMIAGAILALLSGRGLLTMALRFARSNVPLRKAAKKEPPPERVYFWDTPEAKALREDGAEKPAGNESGRI